MASNRPTELPAYIQMKYEENGVFNRMASDVSAAGGEMSRAMGASLTTIQRNATNVASVTRTELSRAFGQAADEAEQQFTGTYERLSKQISAGLARPRNAGGSLDFDIEELKRESQAQEARARAADDVAAAVRRAAEAEGDYSQQARLTIAAAQALAVEEREAAAAARDHAAAMEQIQRELNMTASGTNAIIGSNRKLAGANDNVRYATMGATQQLQDMAVSIYGGQRAGTVMAQQLPQLAFALSGLAGSANTTHDRIGRFATFMSGPWGLAIGLGVGVLATLTAELWETEKAAKAAEIGSSGLSDAQSVLGDMFNLTSGKIEHQNELLVMNARLTALNLRSEAMQQRQNAKDAFGNFGQGSLGLSWMQKGAGALGLPVYATGSLDREREVRGVLGDLQGGKITREEALTKSEKLDFSGLAITKEEFQQALIDDVSAEFKDRTAALIDQSLDSGTLASGLRRDTKPKKDNSADKAAREAERLRKFGESADEAITRLNEKFDQSPKLIDQVAQATRQLDDIMADLEKRKPIGFAKMIEEAKATKDVVVDSLLRPIEEMEDASRRRLEVQDLLAQGRDAESAALQNVWSIEDKLGSEEELRAKVQDLITQGRKEEAAAFEQLLAKYPDMKRRAAELAEVEAQRTREAERQRVLFDAQLDVINTARSSLTDLLSGRDGDFLGSIKQSLKDLQGARLADQLFGDAFAEIEDQLRQHTPLGKATSRLTESVDTSAVRLDDFASAVEDATKRIGAAGLDDAVAASRIDGNVVTVAGTRGTGKTEVDISKLSVVELAMKISGAMVDPFQQSLNDALGTKFGQLLGGTVKNAIAGVMTGGAAGGIIGGLKGIVDEGKLFGGVGGKLSGRLGDGMDGAAMGSQAAGIMKGLGLKTRTTGAQIGGAIGGLTGIPGGDIIGSIAGGLLGGLFKTNRTANAVLTNGESYTQGGKDSGNYETAAGLGDSVLGNLNSIVDKLGGSIGSFMVSIGTRGDEYRVNPNGTSLKLDKGAISFGDDAEAAIAFAVKNAIEDGALKGMRASTLNIIKAGDDLEAALQDALDWENVFKELKSYKDPLGAAMDDLDREFQRYIELAKTAGASSQEMADLQELYGIKQAEAVEEYKDRILGSLQGLYDGLTTGDNGLSLRDRRAAALGNYDDLAARVSAGDTTAYDDYASAAQTLLDIERELYGSQQAYFDRLAEVTDLTKGRIDAESNVVSIAENRDSPFDAAGAVNKSIQSQTDALTTRLDAVNSNIGTLIGLFGQVAGSGNSTSSLQRIAFGGNF